MEQFRNRAAFLFVHVLQAANANSSVRFGSLQWKIPVSKSAKQVNRVDRLLRHGSISHQISLVTWHSLRTWIVSSSSPLQNSKIELVTLWWHRFFFVGGASRQARHRKCLILLGTLILQFFFQKPLCAVGFDCPCFKKILGFIKHTVGRFCWVNSILCSLPNQSINWSTMTKWNTEDNFSFVWQQLLPNSIFNPLRSLIIN